MKTNQTLSDVVQICQALREIPLKKLEALMQEAHKSGKNKYADPGEPFEDITRAEIRRVWNLRRFLAGETVATGRLAS